MAYKVVTLSKEDNRQVGFLGDFDDYTEATEVVEEFNRKADRHPVIASVIPAQNEYDDSEWEEVSSEDELDDLMLDYEDSDDDSEWEEVSSEEVSSEDDEISFNSNPTRPLHRTGRNTQSVESPPRRLSPRRDAKPFMFASTKEDRYYGVIIDNNGKILLREPANHYNNVRWEFYGGETEEGETPTDTVIRETAEETGYTSRPVGKIGIFENNGNTFHFFLLKRLSRQRNWKNFGTKKEETWDTMFVSRSDAEYLLGQNPDSEYTTKLMDIMDKAYKLWRIKNETE